jgi:hypothetical protein
VVDRDEDDRGPWDAVVRRAERERVRACRRHREDVARARLRQVDGVDEDVA